MSSGPQGRQRPSRGESLEDLIANYTIKGVVGLLLLRPPGLSFALVRRLQGAGEARWRQEAVQRSLDGTHNADVLWHEEEGTDHPVTINGP